MIALGVAGLFVFIVVLATLMGNDSNTTQAPEGAAPGTSTGQPQTPGLAPTTSTNAPPPTTQAPTAPAPITFKGTGQSVTDPFTNSRKLIRVSLDHVGESNFIVWFLDSSTGSQELLAANQIGDYNATRYFGLVPDEYVLDIKADGPWTITIQQPIPTTGPTVPLNMTGTRDDAPACIDFSSGLHRFKMHHEGDANFIVWLYDSKGNQKELLANEIGEFNGEHAFGIPSSGFYCVDVVANGPWFVDVRR